jgi:alpha-beta hydrolase superfamily lysophospholipase
MGRRVARRAPGLLGALALLLAACTPQYALPGRPYQPPALTDTDYIGADGLSLATQHWLPEGRPRAIILGLHGFNDYANAFAMPGEWWAAHGIATFAYDQRGFGHTPKAGLWPGENALVDDMFAMVRLLRARYPGVPLYVLGESMGGAVVLAGFSRIEAPAVDGIVLEAPAVWARSTMTAPMRVALWAGAHAAPWLTLTGRGLHITPSDNLPMLIALGRDPLVIKETRIDAIWGLVDLMDDAFHAAAAPRLGGIPLLVLYGRNDQIIPRTPVREMIERLPPDATGARRLGYYPKGYHLLLRDLSAETVWNDVLHWIEDPRAPLPSGDDRGGLSALAELGADGGHGR